MNQGPSADIPAQPPMSAPPVRRGGIPTWLIIAIILVVLCGLGAIVLLCVLPTLGLTLLGPQLGNQFSEVIATIGCQTENPSLSADQCSAWAADIAANQPEAFEACQSAPSSTTTTGSDGGAAFYNCLLDQGVDPPQ